MHTTIVLLEEELARDPRLALVPLVAVVLEDPTVQLAIGARLEWCPFRRLGDISC